MLKTVIFCCTLFGITDETPLPRFSSDKDGYKLPWLDQFSDPEVSMTMREAVTYHGYPFEEYTIHSADGYYTTFHRIPHGKVNTTTENRPPVFIMHGSTGMSSVYIANTPEKNTAYFLAEEGYDVWLGNSRGNDYSRKHDKYSTEDEEFWNFGWHEMGYYDIPVMIDFIIEKTGHKKIHLIGHSMGVTASLAMLASRPEYNQKIKGFYAMAPVAFIRNVEGFLATLNKIAPILTPILKSLKLYEFRHDSEKLNNILEKFIPKKYCDLPFLIACKFGEKTADMLKLNVTRVPVFVRFGVSSTPFQALVHYAQLIKSKKFKLFDYLKTKNLEVYGQPTPPEYPLSNITAPIALFYAAHDTMAKPDDVALLRSQISSPIILDYLVPDPTFLHLEFLWSFNIQTLIFDPLLKVMKKQDQDLN